MLQLYVPTYTQLSYLTHSHNEGIQNYYMLLYIMPI